MKSLTPAYGRDYSSKKEALKDFNDNKDFIINDITSRWDGKPVNKEQLTGESVVLRYKSLKSVHYIAKV